MHKGIVILLSVKPNKYLEPLSLCFNLSGITILSMSIKYKVVACLKA